MKPGEIRAGMHDVVSGPRAIVAAAIMAASGVLFAVNTDQSEAAVAGAEFVVRCTTVSQRGVLQMTNRTDQDMFVDVTGVTTDGQILVLNQLGAGANNGTNNLLLPAELEDGVVVVSRNGEADVRAVNCVPDESTPTTVPDESTPTTVSTLVPPTSPVPSTSSSTSTTIDRPTSTTLGNSPTAVTAPSSSLPSNTSQGGEPGGTSSNENTDKQQSSAATPTLARLALTG